NIEIGRPSKAEKVIAAIGDGISSIANLIYTTHYAPNVKGQGALVRGIKRRDELATEKEKENADKKSTLEEKIAKERDAAARRQRENERRQERLRLQELTRQRREEATKRHEEEKRKKEKEKRNEKGVFTEEDLLDYRLNDSPDFSISGFMGKPNSKENTFFYTNNSSENIRYVEIELIYEDMKGRQLHKQIIKKKVSIPKGETMQIGIPNWDRSGRAVYYRDRDFYDKNNETLTYNVKYKTLRVGY
ncbi:MAG: hypothetical protein K2L28_08170, partial [Muribaculaceae bacterium]|nr:hypothetical protein [Muribaculaceae bacterium]